MAGHDFDQLAAVLHKDGGLKDIQVFIAAIQKLVGGISGTATLDNVGLKDFGAGEYETVAASASDQVIGATGAANNFLHGLLVVPATTSPGNVQIKDGSGTAITVFTGGASSVSNLVPFFIPLGIKCATNWKVTTGSNVSVIAVGNFT